MDYDFAILYYGMTRSVRKTYDSHTKHVFNVLENAKLTYKTFMHTWKTKDDRQNVWAVEIPHKIDYTEYELLSPDFYKLDDEDEFLESVNIDNYFNKDLWETKGDSEYGEWHPRMVMNAICSLESQKRAFIMLKEAVSEGNTFKHIVLIRPDITIHSDLPIETIIANSEKLMLPNHSHFSGYNDQVAIMNYEHVQIYGKKKDELEEFRKTQGRIVGEKYCKYIIDKYNMPLLQVHFEYKITRP